MKFILNPYILTVIVLILINHEKMFTGAKRTLDDVFKEAQKVKCNNSTEERAEELMQLLVPGGTDQHAPETPSELRQYCILASRNIPFALGYFKYCTSPFAQTIAKFMFYPIRKQLDGVCKTGKITRTAKDLMAAGKCSNRARGPLKECNARFMDALNGISLAPIKSRIYMTCCHGMVYRNCLREDSVGCSRQTLDQIERMIMKMVGVGLDLMCGEYFQESDKCNKLIRQTPKPRYSKLNQRPKSFIKPMIALMESFPDLDE